MREFMHVYIHTCAYICYEVHEKQILILDSLLYRQGLPSSVLVVWHILMRDAERAALLVVNALIQDKE
jgi:hypothetical protein